MSNYYVPHTMLKTDSGPYPQRGKTLIIRGVDMHKDSVRDQVKE